MCYTGFGCLSTHIITANNEVLLEELTVLQPGKKEKEKKHTHIFMGLEVSLSC